MTAIRPPFGYYGGKSRMASTIVSLMPAHRIYVEPFAGSLAVLLAKMPATHEVVNDLDGLVVNFWRQLRDRPADLARVCAATPYARDEYSAADLDVDNDLERARRWWVRITQSHGRVCGTAGWSTGVARSGSRARETLNASGRIETVAARLRTVTIENRDALDVIRAYDQTDAVHYVDPPYLSTARNSTGYRIEMGDAESHEALAGVLHGCSGTVILSGYDDPLYDRLYAGWWRTEVAAIKSNAGRLGASTTATEVLWANRTLHEQNQLWSEGGAA